MKHTAVPQAERHPLPPTPALLSLPDSAPRFSCPRQPGSIPRWPPWGTHLKAQLLHLQLVPSVLAQPAQQLGRLAKRVRRRRQLHAVGVGVPAAGRVGVGRVECGDARCAEAMWQQQMTLHVVLEGRWPAQGPPSGGQRNGSWDGLVRAGAQTSDVQGEVEQPSPPHLFFFSSPVAAAFFAAAAASAASLAAASAASLALRCSSLRFLARYLTGQAGGMARTSTSSSRGSGGLRYRAQQFRQAWLVRHRRGGRQRARRAKRAPHFFCSSGVIPASSAASSSCRPPAGRSCSSR